MSRVPERCGLLNCIKNEKFTSYSDSLKFPNTIGNSVISRPASLNRYFSPGYPFITASEGRNKEKLQKSKKKRDSLLELPESHVEVTQRFY